MAWKIDYSDRAGRQVRHLAREQVKRILDYMDYRVGVSQDPRSLGQALTGSLTGDWRYRVGDCLIVCELIDDRLVVLVVEIGHRREVYR